ncbi:MAG TPA: histidine--tRNA ligase [Armatimonadota bacterium]|jgi:histidyl-tRNA synthetase
MPPADTAIIRRRLAKVDEWRTTASHAAEVNMPYSAPKGTQDFLPEDTARWQWLEDTFRRFCARYAYAEIRTPIFEATELFTRSVGEETDIVSKQMYTFESRGGDALTLRPEGTAPVVRAVIQHSLMARGSVQKLYYLGPIFRYERPQKGRYRQFHQVGVEAFGSPGPEIDAEVLALATDFLRGIGITDAQLEINSVGCPECRPRYRDALRSALAGARTELCTDCQRRYEANPLRILDCKVERCRDLSKDVPAILDVLCDACKEHFDGVLTGLRALEIPYVVNPNIVRGLDYYTRTAFEFIAGNLGAQNTVLAGGRYDGLVAELGGPATPAIGFAAGIERLLLSVGESAPLPEQPGPVFIASIGDAAREQALPLATTLRRADIPTALNYGARSLKAQMKEADRQNARFVVILGEDELARGEVMLRDMRGAAQDTLPLEQLVDALLPIYRRQA